MISHYKIKDYPQIKEVISISGLNSLAKENGFLVFIMDTLNEDEANDFVEDLGINNIGVPCVVSTCDMTVSEVCNKLQNEIINEI